MTGSLAGRTAPAGRDRAASSSVRSGQFQQVPGHHDQADGARPQRALAQERDDRLGRAVAASLRLESFAPHPRDERGQFGAVVAVLAAAWVERRQQRRADPRRAVRRSRRGPDPSRISDRNRPGSSMAACRATKPRPSSDRPGARHPQGARRRPAHPRGGRSARPRPARRRVTAPVSGLRALVLAALVHRDDRATGRGQRLEHLQEVFLAARVTGGRAARACGRRRRARLGFQDREAAALGCRPPRPDLVAAFSGTWECSRGRTLSMISRETYGALIPGFAAVASPS